MLLRVLVSIRHLLSYRVGEAHRPGPVGFQPKAGVVGHPRRNSANAAAIASRIMLLSFE